MPAWNGCSLDGMDAGLMSFLRAQALTGGPGGTGTRDKVPFIQPSSFYPILSEQGSGQSLGSINHVINVKYQIPWESRE